MKSVKVQAALEVGCALLVGVVCIELLICAVEYFGFMQICAGLFVVMLSMWVYITYNWRCFELEVTRRQAELLELDALAQRIKEQE
tara:strand:- start:187 stop:444 length:258 start_codon:yes stop_codon:yes gene_type:complete